MRFSLFLTLLLSGVAYSVPYEWTLEKLRRLDELDPNILSEFNLVNELLHMEVAEARANHKSVHYPPMNTFLQETFKTNVWFHSYHSLNKLTRTISKSLKPNRKTKTSRTTISSQLRKSNMDCITHGGVHRRKIKIYPRPEKPQTSFSIF
jgi:hypothetical protein